MITPWGMYMNPMRTGGLLSFARPVAAQPMDSKKGSASETPMPFKQVRRLISILFFMGSRCELFLDSAMSERIARHNFADESLHTITVLRERFHQAIHHDFVVALELTAQSIREEFLREISGKIIPSRRDDRLQLFGG